MNPGTRQTPTFRDAYQGDRTIQQGSDRPHNQDSGHLSRRSGDDQRAYGWCSVLGLDLDDGFSVHFRIYLSRALCGLFFSICAMFQGRNS